MISVMGVLYQPIIEKPISLFYNSEVLHTASNYSYKPGQSGTEYVFYLEKTEGVYEQLNFIETVGLPTFFYLGIIMLIGIIRKKLFKRKDRDYSKGIFKKNPKLILWAKAADEKSRNKGKDFK